MNGCTIGLSGSRLQELLSCNDDRESRKAAITKILADRNVIAPSQTFKQLIYSQQSKENLLRRKEFMLQRLQLRAPGKDKSLLLWQKKKDVFEKLKMLNIPSCQYRNESKKDFVEDNVTPWRNLSDMSKVDYFRALVSPATCKDNLPTGGSLSDYNGSSE